MRTIGLVGTLAVLLVSAGSSPARAESLLDTLERVIPTDGILVRTDTHQGHFSNSALNTLAPVLLELSASAGDFPAISTTPGFTYRYDPALGAFERTSASLGSIFVERADTIGKGRFDVGAAYSFISFETLNGEDLDGFSVVADHDPLASPPDADRDKMRITLAPFNLRSHVVSVFGTYGITDRWDVNVLLPIVHTALEVGRTDQIQGVIDPSTNEPFHSFRNGSLMRTIGPDSNDATGVGDLLLRTKYRFLDSRIADLAAGFTLRVPTGNEDNFQGTGDVIVTPSFIASRSFGRHDVHLALGIDADASNADASRGRWGIGTSIQPVEGVALVLDFIGSSGLTQNTLSETVTNFNEQGEPDGTRTVSDDVRTDIVDLAFGLKWNVYGTGIVYLGAIWPLNPDNGLRTEFTPTGGFEIGF